MRFNGFDLQMELLIISRFFFVLPRSIFGLKFSASKTMNISISELVRSFPSSRSQYKETRRQHINCLGST